MGAAGCWGLGRMMGDRGSGMACACMAVAGQGHIPSVFLHGMFIISEAASRAPLLSLWAIWSQCIMHLLRAHHGIPFVPCFVAPGCVLLGAHDSGRESLLTY